MALRDFQQALADMTLDARLAGAVRRDGVEALDAYSLTPVEMRRLVEVSRQPGMRLNCSLARANRFAGIHDAFPMTCVLLEPELRGLLDELWSRTRPDNYQLSGEDAAFAKLLDARIRAGTSTREYVEEIFRYERVCWELALSIRHHPSPLDVPPVTRVIRFRHDPDRLFGPLERHEAPPEGLPEGDYAVRVTLAGGELEVETAEVRSASGS